MALDCAAIWDEALKTEGAQSRCRAMKLNEPARVCGRQGMQLPGLDADEPTALRYQ